MAQSLLDRMRANPRGDWKISDVEAVCRAHGIKCASPRGGGSHYKISHPALHDILTIPSRRALKPVYVRKPVRLIDSVEAATRNAQT